MGVELPRGMLLRTRLLCQLVAAWSLLFLSTSLYPASTSAQEWSAPRTVFVSTTGHTSDGLFLDAWRSYRDLIGDPVTEEFRPRTSFANVGQADVVQYYEHLALIYLPHEDPGNQVQALDLGRQALDEALAGGGSQALKRALERVVCSPAAAPCVNVVAAGHTLREPFLSYWQSGDTSAWLGLPLTEALTAPDGTRVQYFANGILRVTAADTVDLLPLGRIAAGRAKIAMEPIAQPADVPEYDEALFIPPEAPAPSEPEPTETSWSSGPGPQQGAYKEVVVSISAETMWAYEGGELMMSSLVSTGTAETPEVTTPVGFHAIVAKFDSQTMEGTISGDQYRVEDVPYVMYFDDSGNALHGTYWHNNFGAPMSHGCVNLPMDVAAWMYEWAPVGTAVTVIG
jgi:lipoprotein-anchoring transpeptidase ErfK/SrfK